MTNTDRNDAGKRKGRGVPPLAWIIVGLLVLIAAAAFFSQDGVRNTMPVEADDATAVVDPATVPAPAPAEAPTQ